MKFKEVNGLLVSIEEPKKQYSAPVYLRKFDCPHCGRFYDADVECHAEATIGQMGPGPHIPHSTCPGCKKCMGCSEERIEIKNDPSTY